MQIIKGHWTVDTKISTFSLNHTNSGWATLSETFRHPLCDSVMGQVGGELKGQKRVQRVEKRVGTEPGDMLEWQVHGMSTEGGHLGSTY